MHTILSARSPRWADQEHTAIVLLALFKETQDVYGEIPFAASPVDSEPHGVELYERALAGEFGEVQEPTMEMIQGKVMCRRVGLSAAATSRINELSASMETLKDAISLKLATAEQLASLPALRSEIEAWRLHRVELAQLDAQPEYPMLVDWPTPPSDPFVYLHSPEDEGPVQIQTVADDELPKA